MLERALQELDNNNDPKSLRLKGLFEGELKWAGQKRDIGVFRRLDLAEATDGEPEFAVGLLRRLEKECLAGRGDSAVHSSHHEAAPAV